MHFASMVAFWGAMIFSKEDKNIDLQLARVASIIKTNANSTIVPMILLDIYRALMSWKAGEKCFEGCNHPRYMHGGISGNSCIKGYAKRVSGYKFLKGVKAWTMHLRSLTTSHIEWNLSWLPIGEVMHMSASCYSLLLLGLRSIQPMRHKDYSIIWADNR